MEVEHGLAEAEIVQALQDRIDGGAPLGDEQHALTAGDKRGDEVGNGPALAGTRRALNDEVLTGEDSVDGVVLTSVRRPDQELIGRRSRTAAGASSSPTSALRGRVQSSPPASSRCP
jgi:hypothetical protein